MNTQKLLNTALNGLDSVGFRLDELGITSRLNRHNLAAFVMVEQKHLEGEWDSLQARFDRRRSQIEGLLGNVEARADKVFQPLLQQVSRFRNTAGI